MTDDELADVTVTAQSLIGVIQQPVSLTADSLRHSRAAHSRYQQAMFDGRKQDAKTALAEAFITRTTAHDHDVSHADPTWQEDAIAGDHATATHEELHAQLLSFYATELAK